MGRVNSDNLIGVKTYTWTGFPKIGNFVEMGTDSIVPSVTSFESFPGYDTGKNFRPFPPRRIPSTALLCSMKMFKDQRDTKNPRNQKPALKKNYELLKWVHLLAPKRKFIPLGKATQVSKDAEIIYYFLPLSKKWFMVSSSSHL